MSYDTYSSFDNFGLDKRNCYWMTNSALLFTLRPGFYSNGLNIRSNYDILNGPRGIVPHKHLRNGKAKGQQ